MARNHFYHLYYLSTRDIFISLLGSFSSVLIIFVIIGFAFAYAFEIRCSEKGYIPRMHGFAICFYVVMSLVFQWFLFWSTYSVFHIFIFSAFILMVHLLSLFSHFSFHLHLFNHWYIMFLRSWLILLYEVIVFLF